jgi:D-alanine-D-alanine ligase
LRSGAAVLAALQQQGVAALDWVVNDVADVVQLLQQQVGSVFVFNAVHGRGGEDGQLQALLDAFKVPYTGSGMLASGIAMDKVLTKRIWREMGLPTARYAVVRSDDQASLDVESLSFPLMVKPAREGSSIGMCKVETADQLLAALTQAFQYDDHLLLESWIDGAEYTVAILGDQALPMIQLKTPHGFYDYEAKYLANTTEYLCPCGLPAEQESELQALALRAFRALDARVWGRIDLMVDRQGQPWLLELNTVPGMTDHSLVPMAARAAGLSFEQLVSRIIELSQ